ncbi:glycosyltransferase [Aliarcobacter butzleri]
MKQVLICIPTYNRATALRKQILNLSQINSELLDIAIFDNASLDSTESIVSKILNNVNNLIYFKHNSNLEYQGNIVKILEYAKGNSDKYHYLYILSDDDIIFPKNLNKILYNLDNQHNLVLLTWLQTNYSGALSTRPNSNNMDDIFKTINSTALISSYMYPMNFLKNYDLKEFIKFSNNSFLHIKIITDCLKENKSIYLVDIPIGYEPINFTFRFDILKTFCEDRYIALKYIDEQLNFNNAHDTTIKTTDFLLDRILSWNSINISKYNTSIFSIFKWKIRNKMLSSKSIILFIKLILIKISIIKKIFFNQRKAIELQGIKSQALAIKAFTEEDIEIYKLKNSFNLNYNFSIKFNKLNTFIQQLKEKNSSFAVYGFGLIGKSIIDSLENKTSVIVDQNKELKKYKNIDIIKPNHLNKYQYDYIIISVLGREIEIEKFLVEELKVSKDKLICINLI